MGDSGHSGLAYLRILILAPCGGQHLTEVGQRPKTREETERKGAAPDTESAQLRRRIRRYVLCSTLICIFNVVPLENSMELFRKSDKIIPMCSWQTAYRSIPTYINADQ